LWFYTAESEPQSSNNSVLAPLGVFPWLKDISSLSFLLHPSNRKSFSKVVYSEEWAESVQQSFGNAPQVEKILQSHNKDVDTINQKIGALAAFIKQNLPLKHDDNFFQFAPFLL
jgi:hypothetical protein